MKKYKILLFLFMTIFLILIASKSNATSEHDSKKLLYQDATINSDGSVTVKEALWLNGDYNGAEREIEFYGYNKYPFTGIYSNFSGDSDIYNATEITDVKVYDISQSNFTSINDINNVEKEFKKVESASKGKYGVYTVSESKSNLSVKIFCPAKKKKVFYIEYKIKDAVVVHNDVAELYWCFLENNTYETILDYQLKVHLPQEDKDVMVWAHGPASGYCNIDDYKTLSLKDTNINPYKFETIRIMFDKALVPEATKMSNINGKEYIIQYENAMADSENSSDEKKKIEIENQLSEAFIKLDESPTIYWYNKASELLQKYTWDEVQKQKYQVELEKSKESVNQDWKETVEWEYSYMVKYNSISQYRIKSLIAKIDEGFDESAKAEYYEKANQLQQKLDSHNLSVKQTLLKIVASIYFILGVICIWILLKIVFERRKYYKKYYRDFPSEDNAYIVEYLMSKKVSGKTFSVAILDLIAKKKIRLEKSTTSENDFNLILCKGKFAKTTVENIVIEILFNVVGNNNMCSLEQLRKYGKTNNNSMQISSKLCRFEKNVLKEVEYKGYFKADNKLINLFRKIPIILGIVGYFIGLFISNNGYISLINYYILITILSYLYYKILKLDKRRTSKGQLEYSKWLAHKRFLKDFGNFNQKELPEIILWDRYLVTATVLGCSDQILKQMQIYVNSYEGMEEVQEFLQEYMRYKSMKQLDHSLHSLIHKAHIEASIRSSTSSSNDSSYSSSSGFGGGSSDGGSGGGGGGWSRF